MDKNQLMGARLLELRNQNNMTQEDLAERLAVSRQSISKWELSKTLPDVEKLIQLSEMYHVSIDYLVKGNEEESVSAGEDREQEIMKQEEMQPTFVQIDSEQKESHPAEEGRRFFFLICMVLSGIASLCMIVFAGSILFHYAFYRGNKEQDVVRINQIYEQYTKAEITGITQDGEEFKKVVWLDEPGVVEEDFIWGYFNSGNSKRVTFDYYWKTILLPLLCGILFYLFFIAFYLEWRKRKAISKV